MRNFLLTVNGSDLIEGVDGRRKASMDTEDLIVNHSRKAQVIKNFATIVGR